MVDGDFNVTQILQQTRACRPCAKISFDEISAIIKDEYMTYSERLDWLLEFMRVVREDCAYDFSVNLSLVEIDYVRHAEKLNECDKLVWVMFAILTAEHPEHQIDLSYQQIGLMLSWKPYQVYRSINWLKICKFLIELSDDKFAPPDRENDYRQDAEKIIKMRKFKLWLPMTGVYAVVRKPKLEGEKEKDFKHFNVTKTEADRPQAIAKLMGEMQQAEEENEEQEQELKVTA